ncbi:MAG: type II toxin-antitoxin system YafQ family toxin [Methylobacter sp.]|nr:type II toxin-antitoxin system YafQ family toxin [Methylobacter sp.]
MLTTDSPLPERYNDHSLMGRWVGFRECHIKPDLLLIYEKPNPETLVLARLGSHSDLFK